MRMRILSLGGVPFNAPGEQQMDWTDRLWTPVGQNVRYALAGNLRLIENARQGRPITLSIELPWAWLVAATADALYNLARYPLQTHLLSVDTNDDGLADETYTTIFRRDSSPLDLTPIDPRREYFTGTIYLMEF